MPAIERSRRGLSQLIALKFQFRAAIDQRIENGAASRIGLEVDGGLGSTVDEEIETIKATLERTTGIDIDRLPARPNFEVGAIAPASVDRG